MYTRHLTITSALGFYIRSLRFFPFETCSSDGITFFQTIGARISFTIFQISYACRLYIFRRHSKRVVHYKKTMLTKQNQRCEACLRFSIRAIAHSLTRSFIRSFCHSDCVQIWACTEWLNVCTGCVRHSVCSGMTPKYPCLVSLCLCVCVYVLCCTVEKRKYDENPSLFGGGSVAETVTAFTTFRSLLLYPCRVKFFASPNVAVFFIVLVVAVVVVVVVVSHTP